MKVPSLYAPGYEKARTIDPELAAAYVTQMWASDPLVDAVDADLRKLDRPESARLIQAAFEQRDNVLRDAPRSLQDFIHEVATVPPWYDRDTATHGCRVFLRNSEQFLAAFAAGSIVEGFSTRISKSFAITGRMIDDGVRRLKQNLRHLLDIFLPRGVEPSGDGWKLTLRIRLVHARARALIGGSDEWDHDAWGSPVSAAHVALATAAFSARLLQFAEMLGARIDSDEDREAFMAVWTYDGWVMGVPDELIRHSQAEWLRLYEVGSMCEPPPDIDAIALANCIINSAPVVIGMTDPRERADYARYAYRISRELIGDERADQLNFPPGNRFPTLPWLRAQEHLKRRLGKFLPLMGTTRRRRSFTHLLGLTDLGDAGISYRLPDHVRSDASSRW
ncbi:MAG: oxygenase MpaB family protein [Gammaproteobacteria bacterium]|nr:oxygenase MpaB family protein [Gammaproteobacteria bacterium]MDE0246752.1 oxygenase MpaB family protein [Gammaproteobacteria bacterium]